MTELVILKGPDGKLEGHGEKRCHKCNGNEFYKSGACAPCMRARVRLYNFENRNEISARRKIRYAANAEKVKAKAKAWKAANKERRVVYTRDYYQKNKANILAAASIWLANNKEKAAKRTAAWHQKNPNAKPTYRRNRRARKKQSAGKLSTNLAARLFELQRGKCACCGKPLGKGYHLDHIIPLALGGANSDDNMQLLRATCNRKKSAKHPIDYMQEKGFLL